MHAKLLSAALRGIEAIPVEIEVDIGRGLPGVVVLGLPDAGVKEGRDRIRPAIRNSGFEFPIWRITANLAPADVRKEGPGFDLPLAIGVLAATGQLPERAAERLGEFAVIGELALDGRVRPVRGALSMAIAARGARRKGILLPAANATEAAVLEGFEAISVTSLGEAVRFLGGELAIAATPRSGAPPPSSAEDGVDFAEVRGQASAKRALVVAAAGGHNVLFTGPPGAGKTMLARRFPTILPSLAPEEALEVTRIAGVAGLLGEGAGLVREPPFRAPHHTASEAALVGGGSPPQPGEVTLAHRGVLFLDELPEFGAHKLDTLRQPIEEGRVRIARAGATVEFPAEFVCLAAMNPCPCGFGGDVRRPCRCPPGVVRRYQARVSGPLRDRFDIQVVLHALKPTEARAAASGPCSAELREWVERARARQAARREATRTTVNARLSGSALRRVAALVPEADALLRASAERYMMSARAIVKVVRLARTIADLAGSEGVSTEHVAEAVGYRPAPVAEEPAAGVLAGP
jgi:magnesium chelatase family protein